MLKWISCVAVVCVAADVAAAGVVDLNDFYKDPSVSVVANGSSASFTEDANLGQVILSNDPGLGDPEVIVAAAGRTLSFDYSFTLGGAGNLDEFGAFVIDSDTGLSAGAAFQFFRQTTGSGTVTFDLSSLVSGPTHLGLQFQLSSLPNDAGRTSLLFLSNVRTTDTTTTAVPLPPASLVGLGGLLAASGFGRLRRRRLGACLTA